MGYRYAYRIRPKRLPRETPISGLEAWNRLDMRQALADRDIAAVYRILQKYGVSQRRIAAATGQSQSEISEILAGRLVTSYDVLARIADGLGVQRGRMGLAYDAETRSRFTPPTDPVAGELDPDWWAAY